MRGIQLPSPYKTRYILPAVASEGDNSRGGAIWWCPGEGAGGGHPSRPARGYGGAL